MKARRLRFHVPSMKMSKRESDYSHYRLTLLDRLTLPFRSVRWVRRPSGKPTPIAESRRWTFYFKEILK